MSQPLPAFKHCEIHLEAISHNYRLLRQKIGTETSLMGIVKADAYGHGAVRVARHLEGLGINQLGVAVVSEGLELRAAGIKKPIVVLTGAGEEEFGILLEGELIPVVHQREMAEALNAFGQRRKKRIPVHLKFNTGMNRLGFSVSEAPRVLERLQRWTGLEVVGVMTHLACGDERDHEVTREQLRRFELLLGEMESRGLQARYRHLAASAAILAGYGFGGGLNLVRAGLALYGESPIPRILAADGEMPDAAARLGMTVTSGANNIRHLLWPAMSVKVRILALQSVPPGECVSYGASFHCVRESLIAVLPFGYADGYCRSPKNCFVLIKGRRAPVVGNVCMDLMLVDVTEFGGEVGDEVVLLGVQGSGQITAVELAERFGTISYDVLCRLSKRLEKKYLP